ncbi:hypothetical protein LBMAG42_45000 [Deltaproteobacteria bacterium]|nr:hypothetical protein LBMAG42_45000 [Deltaproteobacteria bacterium]
MGLLRAKVQAGGLGRAGFAHLRGLPLRIGRHGAGRYGQARVEADPRVGPSAALDWVGVPV